MIIALDIETTGLDKKKDKIIEVAFIKFDESTFEIVDSFSTLINPLIPLPEIISNITNIFDEDLKNAPTLDNELKEKIKNFIGENPILGHNTNFDKDFLLAVGIDIKENIVLDTFLLSNIVFLYEKSLNLGSICESLDICLIDAHRAINDTKATIKLFEKIVSRFKELENDKKELLNFIFSKSSQKSFEYYKNYFGFKKEVIQEEEFIKKTLKIIGKYKNTENIVGNDCHRSEKNNRLEENNHSEKTIKEIFLSLPNSEIRQNQLNMSLKIEDSLKNDKKFVIEAPTGVGKTFAYLIPSIIYSLQSGEQVIISTNTKALQDQIFYKDLDFLSKNLNLDFSFAKLKGKKNYFSISRYFYYIFSNGKFSEDEITFLSKLCLWLFDTKYGELDELNFFPLEHYFAKNINSDHFLVLFESNDYKQYEFIFKARSKAQSSNIVIINHSLLMQDSVSSLPIFGQIKNLIVDEAHNLEDTTTDALIKSFSLQNFKDSIEKIQNIMKKSNFYIDNLDIKFENLYSQISLLFDLLLDYNVRQNSFGNEAYESLIEKDFFTQNINIKNILNAVEIQFIEIFNHLQTSPDKVYNALKTEISSLEEFCEILKITLDEKSFSTYISVFSYNKNGNNTLYYTVLNPGNFLKNTLWDKIDSIVLTSATLKVNNDFSYIKNILNLMDFDFISLESDFDYLKQALLFIPNDLGSIKYNNPKVNEFILNFLNITLGKTLILLTSFNSIKDLYLTLNIPLKKKGVSILAQGVGGSKHKIANHFKKFSSSSVILGTDSFWEGVDIPGEDLKYLFIHKFPFLVPTNPIFKARGKLYNNSFKDYSIPKAIIKTKQGFGRLIRTKKDTGIIILLDDRYYSTDWGKIMRSSFPDDINIKTGSSDSFLKLIKSKI